MPPLSNAVITFLSILTLGGQFFSLLLIAVLIIRKVAPKEKKSAKIVNFISENYVAGVLVVSAIATVGSLTLSEVLNFNPCKLCWYQRIFMYPQVVISFLALLANEKIKKYILPLSIIGFLIATYHVLLQMFPAILECNDEVAKCSAVQFAKFGYITIPVMALTAFLMIILICVTAQMKTKK